MKKYIYLFFLLFIGFNISGIANTVFLDDFNSFNIGNNWNYATYVPTYTGNPYILNASNGSLRMVSVMNNGERRGIGTADTFNFTQGSIDIAFQTGALTDTSIPATTQKNIDGVFELFLYNISTSKYMTIKIFGGGFGVDRTINVSSNIDGFTGTYSSPDYEGTYDRDGWNYETYYHFAVEATLAQTKIAIMDNNNTELFSHSYDFNLSSLGYFNIALTQSMGGPNTQCYSDVFIEQVEVNAISGISAIPEPMSWLLLLAGIFVITKYKN